MLEILTIEANNQKVHWSLLIYQTSHIAFSTVLKWSLVHGNRSSYSMTYKEYNVGSFQKGERTSLGLRLKIVRLIHQKGLIILPALQLIMRYPQVIIDESLVKTFLYQDSQSNGKERQMYPLNLSIV